MSALKKKRGGKRREREKRSHLAKKKDALENTGKKELTLDEG